MKVSRKLKNVLVIEGQKSKVSKFIEEVKEKNSIVSVKVPKKIEKISSSFIDSNWNFKRLDESIIYGKVGNTSIFAFTKNNSYEKRIIKIIERLKVDVKFTKLVTDGTDGVLVSQWYSNGVKVKEMKESIKPSKYSVAKVFC